MVAVVEDDESYRLALQRLLKSAGFSVQSFACARGVLEFRLAAGDGLSYRRYPHAGNVRLGSSGKVERGSLPDSHYLCYRTWRRKNAVTGDERGRSEIPRQAI